MKEQDLHIGGIYMSARFNMPVYLNSVNIYEMVCDADGAEITPSDFIEPIELTEEWLTTFGFKQWGDKYTWSKGKLIIHHRKRGFVLRKSVPIIKHVHQLQVLYLSLTGEVLAPFVSGVWK